MHQRPLVVVSLLATTARAGPLASSTNIAERDVTASFRDTADPQGLCGDSQFFPATGQVGDDNPSVADCDALAAESADRHGAFELAGSGERFAHLAVHGSCTLAARLIGGTGAATTIGNADVADLIRSVTRSGSNFTAGGHVAASGQMGCGGAENNVFWTVFNCFEGSGC